MDVSARLELLHQLCDERRLDQPALVVARLVPRVGKEDMHAVQRVCADHVAQYLYGIMLHDADIVQLFQINQLEKVAHAWRVYFQRQIVVFGMRLRDGRRAVAHAESDFQYDGSGAAEGLREIERAGDVGDSVARLQVVDCALLRNRDAPLS